MWCPLCRNVLGAEFESLPTVDRATQNALAQLSAEEAAAEAAAEAAEEVAEAAAAVLAIWAVLSRLSKRLGGKIISAGRGNTGA